MILGVIPARGGSKGIPRKNIKKLMNKPLIQWSIEAAQDSQLLDKFIVSTDDSEISAISSGLGAEVLNRPSELATDGATTVAVLQNIVEQIDASIIVLLQPTSPIRVDNLIDRAIERFLSEKSADSLATGYTSHHFEWGAFENLPRQSIKGFFHDDGNIYIFDSKIVRQGRWIGDNPIKMEIPGIYNIEIDHLSEFWAIEGILRRLMKTKLKNE
tara:strand:+ start:492 stop:1133 length:642 start_codon:yes stop_codon:yes gene_type:complete